MSNGELIDMQSIEYTKDEILMCQHVLYELANANLEDLYTGTVELIGVDEQGREGCSEVDFQEYVAKAAAIIGSVTAAPAVQGEAVDWKDGYRAAMNEAGWAVRELYVNHVHHTGIDGLLKRCQELEQSFIRSAEAAPQPEEQHPAPDVAELVQALEWLRGAINCTPENDKHKSGAWISTKHPMIAKIDDLIASHRKQGGEA